MADPPMAVDHHLHLTVEHLTARLGALRARRLAEDERMVCMERARILQATRDKYAALDGPQRQAAIIRDLCEQATPIIEPEDVVLGRMPEIVPDEGEEGFVGEHPELFARPGVPGWLDSSSIYVPDWGWLIREGIGGIAAFAGERLAQLDATDKRHQGRRGFLTAAVDALDSLALLVRRYADEARRCASLADTPARRRELEAAAERCDRVAWAPPATFVEALQLLQIVHMVLSCLVGGRDVTPGRVDQYLVPLYQRDIANGRLTDAEAAALLAMFLLRLSQTAGNATDFDDNLRRSPCQYTHLYVTVGGTDSEGESAVNDLSFVLLRAIRLLSYKEPTLLVRYHDGISRALMSEVAEMVRDRLPVTIYNDGSAVPGLVRDGVPQELARDYSHSACHNVTISGQEAGTGPGGFHNLPELLLLATNGGCQLTSGGQVGADTPIGGGLASFEALWQAFVEQVGFRLRHVRRQFEQRWEQELTHACPLLPSCLMPDSLDQGRPSWQAARVSHYNHYLLGLATTVDSLIAIRHLVYEADGEALSLGDLVGILEADWSGHEPLREQVRTRLPRYGQDVDEAREMTARLGRLWVDEVRRASEGMDRLQMWPAFYSHMVHVREGRRTPATPDGRRAGDALSENLSPSSGTRGFSATSILNSALALPLNETASGAATLMLSPRDLGDPPEADKLLGLIEGYFRAGGLHLHVNVVDAETLEKARQVPERYTDLMARVAGFSAYFTRLGPHVQEDLIRRYRA